MSAEKFETVIPWADSEKWTPGKWYPMPVGFMERDHDEYVIDGYMIFIYDVEANNGDITPIGSETFTFSQALKICEAHNGDGNMIG